jgi:hypothetical protein
MTKVGSMEKWMRHFSMLPTFVIQNREIIVREFPQLGLVVTVLILLSMAVASR